MTGPDLPPDLAAFEQRLTGQDRPEPGPALRQRVLESVREELGSPTTVRPPLGWFLGATAAAALLWINFSMSVVNNMDFSFADRLEPALVEETADRIRTLVPELPEDEVYRQALLAQRAARPAPGPVPRASLDSLLRQKEMQQWVTR
jgi:hypothetical protein